MNNRVICYIFKQSVNKIGIPKVLILENTSFIYYLKFKTYCILLIKSFYLIPISMGFVSTTNLIRHFAKIIILGIYYTV